MDSTQLEQHAQLHNRLGTLIHRTLLSLLCCYDHSKKTPFFYSAIDTPPGEAHPTFHGKPNAGDTATILLAIERSRESMRRQSSENVSPSDLWPDFWKSVDVFSTKGKIEPISYDSYKKDVFGPGLQKIVNARADSSPSIDQILKSDPNSDPKSDPRQKYSPFKAGRILNLMNKFPDEASHQDLYMEALDCVLESVTRLYPPHHIFGGASLTGAEANSFITHECFTGFVEVI